MGKGRFGRVQKSIISTLCLQITTLLCGLIVPRTLLNAFGSEAYGATTSIAQFLSYITLLEGGIGGVARAALYKPIAEKDTKRISVIVFELKRFFRVIAFISIGYTLVFACSFKNISHITCYSWQTSFLLVIAMAVSTFGQYFIGIAYSALIQADQRVYLINSLSILTIIMNTFMVIVLVRIGSGLVFVKLVSSCVFLIKPTAMWIYVKKRYGLDNNVERDKTSLEQRWDGLGQHIAYYIHSNTDVAVLTILSNLKTVAVYSVYYMVTSHIRSIVIALCSGMEALFGDMIAKDQKNQLRNVFNIYETIIFFACSIFFSTVYVMIIPFISLYTKGIEDANYIQPLFSVLLTTASAIYCLRFPYQSTITAAGHFKQTRVAAYGEAVINIFLSIILVRKYGLIGVAIGTIVAIGFRLVYSAIYLSQNIMHRNFTDFSKRLMINVGSIIVICLICNLAIRKILIDNYLKWIFTAIGVFAISTGITWLINYIFYRDYTKQILNMVIRKVRR